MKEQIVKVIWIDSKAAVAGWEHREDLEELEPVICTTVGFVVSETKRYITIAHTSSEDQILGRITIPKCCIQKQKQLK